MALTDAELSHIPEELRPILTAGDKMVKQRYGSQRMGYRTRMVPEWTLIQDRIKKQSSGTGRSVRAPTHHNHGLRGKSPAKRYDDKLLRIAAGQQTTNTHGVRGGGMTGPEALERYAKREERNKQKKINQRRTPEEPPMQIQSTLGGRSGGGQSRRRARGQSRSTIMTGPQGLGGGSVGSTILGG